MNFEVLINKAGFTGKATIDFPTREEKMKLLQELRTLGYGSAEMDDESAITDSKLNLAAKMGEVVDKRLVSIDVVFDESGTVINDKAMLDIYSEGQALIGVVANFILGGVQLGKEKS